MTTFLFYFSWKRSKPETDVERLINRTGKPNVFDISGIKVIDVFLFGEYYYIMHANVF